MPCISTRVCPLFDLFIPDEGLSLLTRKVGEVIAKVGIRDE